MLRSGYSFKEAAGNLDDIIARLKEIGSESAPIADAYNTFSFVKWRKEATNAGLKPVFGVRLPVTVAIQAKKPVYTDFVFIAKDSIEPLNRLVELAYSQFRYRPNLTYKQMLEAEGVIKLSGHKAQFDLMEPQDDLYIGLSVATTKGFINRALTGGYKLMALQENRFPFKTDQPLYEMVCGRFASSQSYAQHILSQDEWFDGVRSTDEAEKLKAWENYEGAMQRCSSVELPHGEMYDYKPDISLRDACLQGAERLGVDLTNPVYAERLEYELNTIEEKGFVSYFNIVGDLMRWAKDHALLGPGRGSAAGSLVCWLTGITQLDPIAYDLMFERFVSLDRVEPADIDLDISSEKRGLIFEYMENKYGKDYVARLGAVGTFKHDAAMNEVGKALGVPKFECEKVLAVVEAGAAGDEEAAKFALKNAFQTSVGQAFLAKYPEMQIAERLCGHPRNGTQHAAGLILTKKPVRSVVAIDARTQSTMFNKWDAEELDALKIDLLSLETLTIFERTLELAGLPKNFLETIPLDDQKTFDVLNDQRTAGIFQFSGRALRNLTKEIRVTELEDLIALTSLARPGPLQSGGAAQWVARKNGKKEVSYIHESLEPILGKTLGTLIYQEQILRVAREIGGLSWPDVSAFRRAVSKSKGRDALTKFETDFKKGSIERGWTEEQFERLWSELITFSRYGFVRAHAAAYSILSFWSMYLKAHYPAEFFAASLSSESDSEKQLVLLREIAAEGYSYLPVHPELSTDKWTVATIDGKRTLLGSLTLVKGIGPKIISQIMSSRARGEPLSDRIQKLLSNPKTEIDTLYPVENALKKIDLSKHGVRFELTPCGEAKPNGDWWENVICVGVANVIAEHDENEERRIADRIERGQQGVMTGPTKFVEIRLTDSTGTVYAKIGRKEYKDLQPKIEGAKVDKSLILVRGTVCPEAPVLLVKNVKVIGALD